MKLLEKTFASVPERVTNHLDATLPAILTHVIGQAIIPTLTMVLAESLPPTMTLVLEGSLADFQAWFDSAIGADSTLQVWELLEATTDSRISDHVAVIMAIEGIGACLRVLDDIIASSNTSPAHPSLVDVRPPTPAPPPVPPHVPPRPVGSPHMPVPLTWGHGFQPSAPAPTPTPHQSTNPLAQNSKLENNASIVHGLSIDTATANVPGGRIKTPRFTDPARRARNMKTNRFDLAGLANTGYHIGDFGVDILNEMIISKCGY